MEAAFATLELNKKKAHAQESAENRQATSIGKRIRNQKSMLHPIEKERSKYSRERKGLNESAREREREHERARE